MSRHLRSRSRKTLHGRTLVELLIAITIGLVILGALTVVYLSSGLSSRQSTAIARMNEDAATALGFIGPHLRMAGFSVPRIAVSSASAAVDGVATSTPDRNFIGAGIRACDHGFESTTAADFDKDLSCRTDKTGPAAFALRFEGADPEGSDPMRTALPANVDCLSDEIDTPAKQTVGALGVSYPLVESRFFVVTNGTSGTPELSCAGKGNDFSSRPLVQYVEDMRLRFGLAADGVSQDVVSYVDAAKKIDELAGSTDRNWARVVTVRVCLLMRSAEKMPADVGSKYIDCNGDSISTTDGYVRRAYFSTITLRNRGGFARTAS